MSRAHLAVLLVFLVGLAGCSEEIPIGGEGGGFGGGGGFGDGGFGGGFGRWVDPDEARPKSRHKEAWEALEELGASVEFDTETEDYPILAVSHTFEDPTEEQVTAFQEAVAKIDTLKKIDVGHSKPFGDPLVEAVKDVESLRELHLSYTSITPAAIDAIAGMTQLEVLDIDSTAIKPTELVKLEKLTALRELEYSPKYDLDAEVVDAHLEPVGKLVALERLEIPFGSIGNEGLAHLAGLVKLKGLELSGSEIDDDGLAHLSKMTAIEDLSLAGNDITDAGLVHLAPLVNVTSCNLSNTQIQGPGLEQLAGWTRLLRLTMTGCPTTGEGLGVFPSLEALYLGSEYDDTPESTIDDAALANLSNAKSLGHLDLSYLDVGDEGIAHLAGLGVGWLILKGTNVTGTGFAKFPPEGTINLNLDGCPVTDDGAAAIGKLRSVRYLDLDGTPITDAGVSKLGGIAEMQTLYFSGTNIGDEAMTTVGKMTTLQTLDISHTAVTDAGLAKLNGLKSTWQVSVEGSLVTAPGVVALETALGKEGLIDESTLPKVAPILRLEPVDGELQYGAFVGTNRFAAAAEQRHLFFWDLTDGSLVRDVEFDSDMDVRAVAASPDGSKVVVVTHDGFLVDTETFEVTRIAELGYLTAAAFTADGKKLLLGQSEDFDETTGGILTWDVEKGALVGEPAAKGFNLQRMGVSSDAKQAIGRSFGDENTVWNLETGDVVQTFESEFSVDVYAYRSDGEIALSDDEGRITVYDTATWEAKRTLPIETGYGDSYVFSPDGKLAARKKGYDGYVLVDVESGTTLETGKERIPLAFSADSSKLVTTTELSDDRSSLLLWPSKPAE